MSLEIQPTDLVCHNVLAMAELNTSLELDRVVAGFKNCEYEPAKFSCVRIRDWANRCTIAVFASGKLQVTGASHPDSARRAMLRAAFRLKEKIGFSEIIFSGLKFENILATFDVGTKMDLSGLARDPDITCTYMPSQFAGAVVREVKLGTNVVVDVFASGKMNIKGKVSLERMCEGLNALMPFIARHICQVLDDDTSGYIGD